MPTKTESWESVSRCIRTWAILNAALEGDSYRTRRFDRLSIEAWISFHCGQPINVRHNKWVRSVLDKNIHRYRLARETNAPRITTTRSPSAWLLDLIVRDVNRGHVVIGVDSGDICGTHNDGEVWRPLDSIKVHRTNLHVRVPSEARPHGNSFDAGRQTSRRFTIY